MDTSASPAQQVKQGLHADVVPSVCGAMTSGGTESILTAVKAARDYMCAKKGIRHPEMIIAQSAHAAFFKAAEYFKIRLIKAGLLPAACPCPPQVCSV